MKTAPKEKPQIAQARRFANSLTYNAWTALARAQDLMRDAREIQAVLKKEEEGEDRPFRDWYGFEIVSYYLVGLVTCLEWHARTRLTDLYTYRPECIERSTIDRYVSSEALAQMISANLTIPHLLSAGQTVGSVDEYYSSLQRVFDTLQIGMKVAKVVQPERTQLNSIFGESFTEPSVYENLTELFTARHDLVHEIGIGRMSSPAISDNWDVEQVLRVGGEVVAVIRAFERTLAEHAPHDFPNLLDAQLHPIDEQSRLQREIDTVVRRISNKIEVISETRGIDERDAWAQTAAEHDALQTFIGQSDLFKRRYTDPGRDLAKLELQHRLKLLKALDYELGNPRLSEIE